MQNFDNLIRDKWTKQNYKDFCNQLMSLSEGGYHDFSKNLTPTERPFMGVRIPYQREMAKAIRKGNYQEFLSFEPVSFEEVNVHGFVIASLPYDEMKKRFAAHVERIDNWSSCDTFCASLKSIRKNRADFLDTVDDNLKSLNEFNVRVALVILLDHYVTPDAPEYLQVIFDRIREFEGLISDGPGEMKALAWDAYYVKMAIAWLLAECYIKFPDDTHEFLSNSHLPKWTFNKTISKICDSYRVDRDRKTELKQMRMV